MMKRKQYREALDKLGMTQRGAARFLDIGERTSRRLAKDKVVPRPIEFVLKLMTAKGITPEEVFEIAGYKFPEEGFGDQRERMLQENDAAKEARA